MHVFLENFQSITWQMVVMWAIGALLIYLAIKKDMEPTLLLPMGFGAILINLPLPSVAEAAETTGVAAVLETLYNAGIRNELFPLLLFIGIGAMIDFGPLLSNPKMLLFGAAAQFPWRRSWALTLRTRLPSPSLARRTAPLPSW